MNSDIRKNRAFRAALALTALSFTLLSLGSAVASAAPKQVIAYFGTESGEGTRGGEFSTPGDVAVNASGAGPANAGDIYVVDSGNNRLERFAQDNNGTPGDPYDDSYPFVSAWGADVDASSVGGSSYEVCTVAASCKAGVASGGDGTVAGDGALSNSGFGNYPPTGIAIDQDTGDVYVDDNNNARVNVYTGDGSFLRSFGWDVVLSGPDNVGTGFEICIAANDDICKEGVGGAGSGQLGGSTFEGVFRGLSEGIAISPPDGIPGSGTVFVADRLNHRINTYNLDGTSPSSFGAVGFSPGDVAVDSRGIVYTSDLASPRQVSRYDSQNADGAGIGFLAPITEPPLLAGQLQGIAVKPDADGAGPDKDVLYVLHGNEDPSVVQQFGPINEPGLVAPPIAEDEEHGAVARLGLIDGLGLDPASGRLFVSSIYGIGGTESEGGAPPKSGVYVLDKAGGAATATLESLSDVTSTSVTLHGKVNPNGPPDVSFHAEYSLDGSDWVVDPGTTKSVGSQESPVDVTATVDPAGGGLEPNTTYHFRLVATRPFNPPVRTDELSGKTALAPPLAETTGSPSRSATTARLLGRVSARNLATTVHFEYGDEGSCETNPCATTAPLSAGSSGLYRPVAQLVSNLRPGTVYHYRIVADNGASGAPGFGEDMTVTTRASDAPLSHGHFAGPAGSDRAWEQVNLAETGGNPVSAGVSFSDNGDRAIYNTYGGNPSSQVGSLLSQFFSERTSSGWQADPSIYPLRSELAGATFLPPSGRSDLSSYVLFNRSQNGNERAFFRISPGAQPVKLFSPVLPQEYAQWYAGSAGSDRAVALLLGGIIDPVFPEAAASKNLYDITAGAPHLLSLMPDNSVPNCGAEKPTPFEEEPASTSNWISADGSLLFFPSQGQGPCGASGTPSQIYMREIEAGQTKLVSGPALSGSNCPAFFIKSNPGAAFFWTQTRLATEDTNPASCNPVTGAPDGDVYRYDLATGAFKCLTCVVPNLDADVFPGTASSAGGDIRKAIAVAGDGSRVYFQSPNRLTAGAGTTTTGQGNTYRVDVRTGAVRWLGAGLEAGEISQEGSAINSDGSVAVFRSRDPDLNPIGEGSDNGGTFQYYLYDDRDRSLSCVSCASDGTAARSSVPLTLRGGGQQSVEGGANATPLAADGTFAFSTAEALIGADQNTARGGQEPARGSDIYEWRDGKQLLVTDGLTNWPQEQAPLISGVDPSGRDVFFLEASQLTPDALDGYARLYDARIGGGFEFPPPPKPCPLEVCQGTPKGAPEEQPPGTNNFIGRGNVHQPAHGKKTKKKKSHKKRHHKKQHHKKHHRRQRANHDRRAAR